MKQYDENILEAAAEITAAAAEEAELSMDSEGARTAAKFLRTLYRELAADEEHPDQEGGVFEVYRDKSGEYRFRLKAKNGEVIAVSEGYKRKESCLNGIASVQHYAKLAKIEICQD